MDVLLTDILECKKILQIPLEDHSQDYALNYYIMAAVDMIGEFLNRPNFYKKSRTEYYNGTGTQKLLLNSRPVYISPEPVVYSDLTGVWGEDEDSFSGNPLEYGKDYAVWLDTVTPSTGVMDTSRCGILVRKSDYWQKPIVRQAGFLSPFVGPSFGNIKITYTAGYTLDNMPPMVRMACIETVGRLKFLFPLTVPTSSESYEERHITMSIGERNYLLGQCKHLLTQHRNWKF